MLHQHFADKDEADALSVGFSRKERGEQLCFHFLADALACIANFQHYRRGRSTDHDLSVFLDAFGEQVIREMNRVGMMVDISHAGEQTFYDALNISTKPIVASHSSSRALCNHPRNLTDDQLKALAAKGGVAQVTLYNGFLKEEGTATIQDAIAHLNHMVDVMGIEHVGIGTDFDGDGGIIGCASASELINFTRCLLKERYSEEDIRRIWGGNFLRTMEEVQRI